MSTSQRPESGWNVLLMLSVVGIIAGAWFSFRPKPVASQKTEAPATLESIHRTTDKINDKAKPAEDQLKKRTWNLTAEVFGSTILDRLTELAGKNHLQLAGFHIGRSLPAAAMEEAPVIAVVEGNFMDVMALVNDVEQPEQKLALSQLHVASNGGSDRVRATLDLTGFLYREVR